MFSFDFIDKFGSVVLNSTHMAARTQPGKPIKTHLNEISYSRLNARFDDYDLSEFGVSDSIPVAITVLRHGLKSENQGVRDAFKRFYMLAKLSIDSDNEEFAEVTSYMSRLERDNQRITEDNRRAQEAYEREIASHRSQRQFHLENLINEWNAKFLSECADHMRAIHKTRKKHTEIQRVIIDTFEEEFEGLESKWWLKFDQERFKLEMPNLDDVLYVKSEQDQIIENIAGEVRAEIIEIFQDIVSKYSFKLIDEYKESVKTIKRNFLELKELTIERQELERERYYRNQRDFVFNSRNHYDNYNNYNRTFEIDWFQEEIDQLDNQIEVVKGHLNNEAFVLSKKIHERACHYISMMWPNDFPTIDSTKILSALSYHHIIDHIGFGNKLREFDE